MLNSPTFHWRIGEDLAIMSAGAGMESEDTAMDGYAKKPRAARRLVDQQWQEPARRQPQRQPARQPQPQHRLPVSPELAKTAMTAGPEGLTNAMAWGGCPVRRPAGPQAVRRSCRRLVNRKTPVALVGGAGAPREGAMGGRLVSLVSGAPR